MRTVAVRRLDGSVRRMFLSGMRALGQVQVALGKTRRTNRGRSECVLMEYATDREYPFWHEINEDRLVSISREHTA